MKDNPEKYKSTRNEIAREAGDGAREGNPLFTRTKGKLVIHHKAVAKTLVKFLNALPIHSMIKTVMTLRLVGCESNQYIPMSTLQVALMLGLREQTVCDIEKDGKKICGEYLSKMNLSEGVDKFNQNSRAERDLKKIIENS